jgi:hypothetical protein
MTVTFKGAAKRLDDIDLPKLGHRIGVGEDEIHAVLDVEAAGSGFDAQGRVKALYEPHKAYALSKGAVRAQLVSAGLAYPRWGEQPYPKDSYPRILAAMAIDETIALKATSWGLGQVMGFNHAAAGYATPQAMVSAFAEDEEHHLEAMISFIIVDGLDDEIRRHDWAGLARGYNGSGYAENRYDVKLAAAFAKWSKIKDTPWSPSDAVKVEDLPKAPPPSRPLDWGDATAITQNGVTLQKPTDPPPAVIVSDVPIKPPGFWTSLIAVLIAAFRGK